jgi:hypothetical protein
MILMKKMILPLLVAFPFSQRTSNKNNNHGHYRGGESLNLVQILFMSTFPRERKNKVQELSLQVLLKFPQKNLQILSLPLNSRGNKLGHTTQITITILTIIIQGLTITPWDHRKGDFLLLLTIRQDHHIFMLEVHRHLLLLLLLALLLTVEDDLEVVITACITVVVVMVLVPVKQRCILVPIILQLSVLVDRRRATLVLVLVFLISPTVQISSPHVSIIITNIAFIAVAMNYDPLLLAMEQRNASDMSP